MTGSEMKTASDNSRFEIKSPGLFWGVSIASALSAACLFRMQSLSVTPGLIVATIVVGTFFTVAIQYLSGPEKLRRPSVNLSRREVAFNSEVLARRAPTISYMPSSDDKSDRALKRSEEE